MIMPANVVQVAPGEETRACLDAIAPSAAQDHGMHVEQPAASCLVASRFALTRRVGELALWFETRWYESVRGEKSHRRTQLLCLGLLVALLVVLPLLVSSTTSLREAKGICRERFVRADAQDVEDADGHILYTQHGMNCMATLVSFCGYWMWLVASPHTLTTEAARLDRTRAWFVRACVCNVIWGGA